MENLSSQSSIAEKIGQDSEIVSWLHKRIQKEEKTTTQNKQYAAEILAILLQSSQKNRDKFVDLDGVDTLLRLLSAYRKRDPEKDSDEEEYVENLFGCLTCLVDSVAGKGKFVEAEGVELAQIMLREGKMSKPRALRVLNHAVGGKDGAQVCERLVDAGLLRTIFGMFMKKVRQQVLYLIRGVPNNSIARQSNRRTFARHICFATTLASGRVSRTYSDFGQIRREGLRKGQPTSSTSTRLCIKAFARGPSYCPGKNKFEQR